MIVQYCDVLTNEELFSVKNPSYIPNINEKIIFANLTDAYKGFVEDKIITIDGFNNVTFVKIYLRINKK